MTILRTPGQAADIFGLEGPFPARPKNLFYCRFNQADSASLNWTRDLGFVVKSVDRPAIQPTVEEVNQYNKKRQIHTGYKTTPVRLTIYDTADSIALQMWSVYTRHYFGDFRKTNGDSWSYDVARDEFLDQSGNDGFGFSPINNPNPNVQQFFFSSLSIYQVYGNQYVQFDLINPKITSFDPDELNYEDSTASLVNITIAYEAILIMNEGAPQPIGSDEALREAFATRFGGDYLDIPSVADNSFGTSSRASLNDALIPGFGGNEQARTPDLRSYSSSAAGGVLSSFGDFNFGSVIGNNSSPTPTNPLSSFISSDLTNTASNDPVLASLLSIAGARSSRNIGDRLARPYEEDASLGATALDVATSVIETAGGRSTGTEFDSFISAVSGAARLAGASPRDEVTNNGGLGFSETALGIINSGRSPTSQLGFNNMLRNLF